MSIKNNIKISKWMEGSGPESDIVISSRIRLARNLMNFPFTHMMTQKQAEKIFEEVKETIENNSVLAKDIEIIKIKDLSLIERQVLVEKHLISPALAENPEGAVFLTEDNSLSIMVNEEDHLRIQCLYPGLNLEKAWDINSKIDDLLEERLTFAFDEKKGYLTACPTNVGTGLRVSVMLHLPTLVMTQHINRIFATIGQVGLTVRGLYGEGTEAIGNIFQISNQITLGQREEDIINNLKNVTQQIIDRERSARDYLMKERSMHLKDIIGRAYGTLKHAYVVSTKEAMELLSNVRLGVDFGLIEGIDRKLLNELMILIRPANIQKFYETELDEEQRDIKRAELLRRYLGSM